MSALTVAVYSCSVLRGQKMAPYHLDSFATVCMLDWTWGTPLLVFLTTESSLQGLWPFKIGSQWIAQYGIELGKPIPHEYLGLRASDPIPSPSQEHTVQMDKAIPPESTVMKSREAHIAVQGSAQFTVSSIPSLPSFIRISPLLRLLQNQTLPLPFLLVPRLGKKTMPVRNVLVKRPCQFPWVSTSLPDKQRQACLSPRGMRNGYGCWMDHPSSSCSHNPFPTNQSKWCFYCQSSK